MTQLEKTIDFRVHLAPHKSVDCLKDAKPPISRKPAVALKSIGGVFVGQYSYITLAKPTLVCADEDSMHVASFVYCTHSPPSTPITLLVT